MRQRSDRTFSTFLEWHAAREHRLAEVGLALAKAPPTDERDRLVVKIGLALKAHGALCEPIRERMDAHFISGGSPDQFDHGIDVDALDAGDSELHAAAIRLLPTPAGAAN